MKLRVAYHWQALKHSFGFLLSKPMASLMTILVIAITLTLPALFWVFTDNMAQLMHDWRRDGHISLYLVVPLQTADEAALLAQVQGTPGVGEAVLKSAAEGLAALQQQEGMHDIMQYLPENPLPAVIDVTPAVDVNTPEQLDKLYQVLKAYPHVEQAKLDMQWITRLYTILGFATKLAHGLMALLGMAVILIVGNTLRLAVHHRYEEIQVLKLIGATNAYIMRPFLYFGIWYGLAGACVAALFVNLFIFSMAFVVNQLAALYDMHYPLQGLSLRQTVLLIVSAILLGWLGARLSVKRQLQAIEPGA